MRVLGSLVMRNEAARWLDCCLAWNVPLVNAFFVYDDQSTDDSVKVAQARGCVVSQRPDGVPPLLVHEGRFREAAWRAFEEAMNPAEGDWVLAIDADEFVASTQDESEAVYWACRDATDDGAIGLRLTIPEVFAVQGSPAAEEFLTRPEVRVDGMWASIAGVRLFEWQPDGHFPDRALASGSAPSYVAEGAINAIEGLWLLHYGYAHPGDRQEKYQRYVARPGHAVAHVASIVEEPVLQLWGGPYTNVYRGVR